MILINDNPIFNKDNILALLNHFLYIFLGSGVGEGGLWSFIPIHLMDLGYNTRKQVIRVSQRTA